MTATGRSNRDYSSVVPLLAWLGGLATITLFPWDFGYPGAAFAFDWQRFTDAKNVTLNVALFVPWGVIVAREARRRSVGVAATLTAAGAAGLLMTSVIEYLQVFLPGRQASVVDIVSNTGGALVGAMWRGTWAAAGVEHPPRDERHRSGRLLGGAVAVFTVLALLVSGILQLRTRLSNWSSQYPLIVGNEDTGERPWRGRIYAVELTDSPTSVDVIRRFSSGDEITMAGEALARFDFQGVSPFEDASGHLPALDWDVDRGVPAMESGVRLTGRSWLRTTGPAAAIAERLQDTNGFTVRVRCATDALAQTGPARIISYSADTARRNFTLGQRGTDLVVRVRTPHTGANGVRPEIVVPDVFLSTRPVEILASYDGRALYTSVAGWGHVHRTRLTPGSSLWTAVASLDMRENALVVFDLAYVAAMFLTGGLMLASALVSFSRRLLVGGVWAVFLAFAFESTAVFASGWFFDWSYATRNALLGLLIVTATAATALRAGASARSGQTPQTSPSCA